MVYKVFLGLGSNLGDRKRNLEEALGRISKEAGRIRRISSVYETLPWGFETSGSFLNMVVKLDTDLPPQALLGKLLLTEALMGRKREGVVYSSRPIDIDILMIGNMIINENDLVVPHPRMALRKFVLVPLCEISPGAIHPVLRKRICTLLRESIDESNPVRYSIPLSAKLK